MNIIVYCDGGARGNPGQAAFGCILKIRNSKSEIRNEKISGYLGHATNNQAEYQAVIRALEFIRDKAGDRLAIDAIDFHLDSLLVAEQLNGNYKIKDAKLKPLYWQARDLVVKLGGAVSFSYVPRSQNREADRLVNEILNANKNHVMKKGFSFLELMMAVAILGTLASFVILQTAGARKSSLDNRRKSDLLNVQSALELYYAKASPKAYPESRASTPPNPPSFVPLALVLAPALVNNGFLSSLPEDPTYNPSGSLCGSLTWASRYYYSSDGSQYKILDGCPINSNIAKAAATDSFLDPARPANRSWMVCRGAQACESW